MISDEVRKYCRKIYHHLIENYDEAINSEEMYICHHRKEIDKDGRNAFSADELIDLGEYFHRPPEELIFLTKSEHKALHQAANNKDRNVSEEHKREVAKARQKRYREKHKEELNQKAKDRYATDPEYREKRQKQNREKAKRFKEQHPNYNKKSLEKFRKENPDYYKKYYTKKS